LLFVVAAPLSGPDTTRFNDLKDALSRLVGRDLSIRVRTPDSIEAKLQVSLRQSGRLLSGDDVLTGLPAPDMREFLSENMHLAAMLSLRIRQPLRSVRLPLKVPAPEATFFGYVDAPSNGDAGTTRTMVGMVSRMATAIVARKGQMAGSRADAFRLYQQTVGGEWGRFLVELDAFCFGRWQYRLPDNDADLSKLRDLCARVLGFETHFMAEYAAYLGDCDREKRAEDPKQLVESTLNYLLRLG